jgi:hypothetical protein
MFLTFLDKLGGFFDRRFIIAFWMPVLVFVGLAGGTWIFVKGAIQTLKSWNQLGATETAVLMTAALFGITLLAFLLQSLSAPVLRLYAGYWPIGWIKHWGEMRQAQSRSCALEKKVIDWYYTFSRPAERETPQPTRLGNVLTASYDYSEEVYGVSAPLWWSRLTPLLPETIRTQVDNSLTPLFALVNLSTVMIVTALGGSILVAWLAQRWWLAPLYLIGGLAIARLCYLAAINQAIAYGENIRVAFDLYRLDVLEQMHVALPKSASEEARLWRNLRNWIYDYTKPWHGHEDNSIPSAPAQDFHYDNKSTPPEVDEITISSEGTALFEIVRKRVPEVHNPSVPAANEKEQAICTPVPANAGSADSVTGQTALAEVAQEPGDSAKEPIRKRIHKQFVRFRDAIKNWIYRQSMGWLALVLVAAIGGAEAWAMTLGTHKTVIRATRNLPPLTVITAADISETQTRTATAQPVQSSEEATGRITLSAISVGTIIESNMLSTSGSLSAEELKGRQVFSLPTENAPVLLLGEKAIVLGIESGGTPPKEEVTRISSDALSLGVREGRLLLALTDTDSTNLALYILTQRRFLVLRKLETNTPINQTKTANGLKPGPT